MHFISYIFIIFLGLAVGSFLNVCIYRLPLDKSILLPSSFCPKCKKKISSWDNIPVLSYILLKGRCRNCRARISFRYPLVELLTSFWFFFVFLKSGLGWESVALLFLGCSLIVIFFIDLQHKIIPDVITLPGVVLGILFSFLIPEKSFINSLLGLFVGGGLFYLFAILGEAIFKRESLGGGDIKLALMLGAFLGWEKILLVFFLAAILGSIIGILFMFLSQKVRKEKIIPFGPFLALAAFLGILWGEKLIRYYLDTFLGL
ncbi:MAG: hypothetical protein AMJ90_02525 [candidate division Zixibacteria bacterium SM23_73_2]|nr:MAG: hypothetical protein AMJ90_02525 [candidate division Zixibacteria bacterium SM23_73_2]